MLEILLNGIATGCIAFIVFMGILKFAAWRFVNKMKKERNDTGNTR